MEKSTENLMKKSNLGLVSGNGDNELPEIPENSRDKLSISSLWKTLNPYIIIIAIVILSIYTAIIEPQFLTWQNFQNILKQLGVLSLTSIGMTYVIIAGYIDLSIVGMFSFVTVSLLKMIPIIGEGPAILIGILLGILCGLLDAIILVIAGARNDADAVFVTFGISTFYFGLALVVSQGATMRIPSGSTIFSFIGKELILSLPISIYVFLVVMILAHLLLAKTQTGREIRYTGGNRAAARLAGISSAKSTIIAYAVLGLTVGIGSVLFAGRTTAAGPMVGTGMEVNSILAVVIGGTRLKGGLGSVPRTFIGVLLVIVMENALNLIGIPTTVRDIFKGSILILAIWLDYRRR